MEVLPEGDRRRQNATALGYQSLVSDLLRDGEPSDKDLALICVAVADAAMAGDRQLLELVDQMMERLDTCLPEERWADEWRGRLWSVGQFAAAARALVVEGRSAAD